MELTVLAINAINNYYRIADQRKKHNLSIKERISSKAPTLFSECKGMDVIILRGSKEI